MNIKIYDCIPPTDDSDYLRPNDRITDSIDRRYKVPVFDYTNDRLCELCLIQDDFNTFEEVITKIVLDRQFLIADQQKLYPPLRRLFFEKISAICCFLDSVYTATIRRRNDEFRTFHVEEMIDQMLNRKFEEQKNQFYEMNDSHLLF